MHGYRMSRDERLDCRLNTQSEKRSLVILNGRSVKFHDATQIERHKPSEVRDSFTTNIKKEEIVSSEHEHDCIYTGTVQCRTSRTLRPKPGENVLSLVSY